MNILIQGATIINEGQRFVGSVVISEGKIEAISPRPLPIEQFQRVIDATGLLLLPGIIDTHVHFRDPGLTHKGDIYTESRAAAAGGVTTALDMPNTLPTTTSATALLEKAHLAAEKSLINMGFYIGATRDNAADIKTIDPALYCGVKVFLGASTGNMLLDSEEPLNQVFSTAKKPVVAHCEDQSILSHLYNQAREKYGEDAPIALHSQLRPAEACIVATQKAIQLASRHDTRLHIAHVSTSTELNLISDAPSNITAEVCPTYLLFNDQDYYTKGALIKCNPAVKTADDQEALLRGLSNGQAFSIGTDHAPHLFEEKQGGALRAASGIPMIQFSLPAMLDFVREGRLSYEQLVTLMCHHPAELFSLSKRGYIREGYDADLTIVDPNKDWTLTEDMIVSRCKWSPLMGRTFSHQVVATFVKGKQVFGRE